jgi:hypothetical protein
MKTMKQLLTEIANGDVTVTSVESIMTDQGGIVQVHMQSMQQPDTLAIRITLPYEATDLYNLQECGRAWQDGWKKLSADLDKRD